MVKLPNICYLWKSPVCALYRTSKQTVTYCDVWSHKNALKYNVHYRDKNSIAGSQEGIHKTLGYSPNPGSLIKWVRYLTMGIALGMTNPGSTNYTTVSQLTDHCYIIYIILYIYIYIYNIYIYLYIYNIYIYILYIYIYLYLFFSLYISITLSISLFFSISLSISLLYLSSLLSLSFFLSLSLLYLSLSSLYIYREAGVLIGLSTESVV